MKAINAYVRPGRAPKTLDALMRLGIRHVTLAHVTAVGAHAECADAKASIEFGCQSNPLTKLEIYCLDQDEAAVVQAIRTAACTHQAGDGIIAVTNVNRLVKIRTAAESIDALR